MFAKDGTEYQIAHIIWEAAVTPPADDEIALSFTVDEGLTVTVDDKAVTAPINVAKNAEVTFKVTPNSNLYAVKAVKFGGTELTAGAGGVYTIADVGSTDATVTITADSFKVPATKVTISGNSTADMKVGGAVTLTAATEPTGTCTDEVTWASRDAGVATVSNGVVTAKGIGKTTITATAGTKTDTRDVIVTGADQTGKSYTFESKKMGIVAAYGENTEVKYDNRFSVMFGTATKVDANSKSWTDGYSSGQRLGMGGAGNTSQNALKITTGNPATVKIWWVSNKAGGRMALQDSTGAAVTDQETAASASGNAVSNSELSIPAAGTYYLVSTGTQEDGTSAGGNYLFKVVVTEDETTPVENITLTHGHTEDDGDGTGHTIYAGGDGGQGDKTWVGDTTKLYPGSWKMDVTVEPATADQGVIWSVEAAEGETECPIKVDQNGVVSPVAGKLGTGVVVATAKGDTTKVAHCDVIVAPYITGVTIGQTNPTTTMGVADADKLKLTATLALAGGITVSQLSDGQDDITWASSDTSVLTVNSSGVVTPVKAGKANVTATTEELGPRAEAKTATVEVTVNKGTLNMGVSVDSDTQPSAGGTAVVTVTGIRPNGDLDNVTVTAQATGGQVITGTKEGTEANQWNVELPANSESTPVEYTITVAYNGTNWEAATKTATVTVAAVGQKTLTVTLATPGNATEIEEGDSLVITAAPKLDGTATGNVTYQWKKDGADISGATSATLTVTEAGSYTCTVTGASGTDADGLTKTSSPVTVTVKKPALQSISAALKAEVDGVTYTPGATNNLVINGKKTVVFDVTMTPPENDDTLETDLEVVDGLELVSATYDATAKTLTVTPKRASVNENVPRTLTLKGTEHPDVKWEVKIAVKKLAAPATLAKANVTTTAPTAANGKGTITITNAVAGQVYRYKTSAATDWTDTPAATGTTVTINVNPGTYQVRQKVDAVFQNVPGSLTVTVPAYDAPSHSITVDEDISDGTITVVPEESAPEGVTVEVTVTPDDGYRLLKLWYVKAGETAENVITKTGSVYSFTMPEKDVTIYATFEEGEPEPGPKPVSKDALTAAIASAADTMDGIVVDTAAANVDKGALWVTAAEKKALTDAVTAAQTVAAKTDATQAEVDAAVKALAAAVDTFVAAVKDGEKTVTSGTVEVSKVLEGKDLDVFGENTKADGDTEDVAGYFTIIYSTKSKVEDRGAENKKTWDDGYEAQQRLNLGGKVLTNKNSIKFTTTGAATVKIWWVEGKSNAANGMAILGENKAVVVKTNGTSYTQNEPYYSELALTAAGTYYLGGELDNNYIFKVQVVETVSAGDAPVEETANKTALKKAVSDAEAAIAAAKVSTDGKDVSTSDKWVTQADVDALNVALKAANLVVRNAKAAQDKVDAATMKLTAAIAALKAAEQAGTKTDGGSSSSGGGASSMVPTTSGGGTTVTNPDGSKTSTKTNSSTGTITETTTWPNGDKTVVVTEKDGTVTETSTKKDGSKTETVSKPDGSSSIAVTEPNGVKTETATKPDGETTAKVTLPNRVDKAVVTIPVKDVTDGTVAVIVKADGTEQIIKTAIATEGGLEMLVDKNVSVKIKDNAKKFVDIADDYWAKGAVDFTSSREIFKGVTETIFAPIDEVNRGMMATVLYRLADAKAEGENVFFDVADGIWYTDAVVWANRSGVVTGYADGNFGPADAITREQMATMLYRFAKVAGMGTAAKGDVSKFSDGADVSSWASEAMAWAVGVGLINGVGDPVQGTILAPAKTASRAEVATLMQRMVKLMMQ